MAERVKEGWALPKTESEKHDLLMETYHYFIERPNFGGNEALELGASLTSVTLCGQWNSGGQDDLIPTVADYGDKQFCRTCGRALKKRTAERALPIMPENITDKATTQKLTVTIVKDESDAQTPEQNETAKAEVVAVEGKDMYEVMEGMDIVLVSQEMSGNAILRECVVMWEDKEGQPHYELNYLGIKQLVRSYETDHNTMLEVDDITTDLISIPDTDGTAHPVWSATAWVKDKATGRRLPGYADMPAMKKGWDIGGSKAMVPDKFARRASCSLALRNAYKQHLPMAFVEVFIKQMAELGRVLEVAPPWKSGAGGGKRMTATKSAIPEKTEKEVKASQLAKFHVKWNRMLKAVAEESGVVTQGDAVNMKRAFAASLTQAARLSFADMGPGDLMAAAKKLDEKWDDILSWLATGRYVDALSSYGIALETQGEAKTNDPTPNGPAAPAPNTDEIDTSGPTREELDTGLPTCAKCGKELSSQEVDGSIAVNMAPHCRQHLGEAVTARFSTAKEVDPNREPSESGAAGDELGVGRDDGDPGPTPPESGRR